MMPQAKAFGQCACQVLALPPSPAAVAASAGRDPPAAHEPIQRVYRNADTGHASWRSILWRRWPAAGAPPFFTSPEQYDRTVRMLVDSGVILDHKMIYWDVRPSANFPTVEVRVADVPATVDETVLLATLIRAAVMTALEADGRGDDGARLPPAALRAAYWKAAHDGLSGHLLDSVNDSAAVPARQQMDALVQRVRPALEALGEYDRVTAELDRILAQGNGAMRQRRYGKGAAT